MSELKSEAVLAFLGLDSKTEDEFKAQFEAKFGGGKEALLKDAAFTGKIFGQKIGSIEAKIKSNAKKMGVEFTPEEIKDKGVEDILELSFAKVAALNKSAMEEIEKTSKAPVEEQVKNWKDKYTALESKHKDTENLLTKTASEYEGFKKDSITASKTRTINGFKQDALGKLEFKQDITPVEKAGFQSVLDEKYVFDLDENQVPFVADKKTGQRIASKKVVGTFMSAEEILKEELIANKLAKVNPSGGKKVANPYATTQEPAKGIPSAANGAKELFIHPRARAAAGL